MLSKMSLLLAASAVVLSASAASAEHFDGNYSYHRHHHHYRGDNALAIDFGTVAFGYNDGYWDNGHRWHAWRNQSDYQGYRQHGQNFHDWHHDRDNDNGWHNR